MAKKNTTGLQRYTKAKNDETIEKVNAAIDKLKRSKTAQINFSTVAKDGNVKICAVEKSPKSEIYAISNLFF